MKLRYSFLTIVILFVFNNLFSQPVIQWQNSFGGSSTEEPYAIKKCWDGGFAIIGSTNSTNGDISTNKGLYDIWVIKLNSSGNLEWEKSFGGSSYDYPGSIFVTKDHGFIIAGYTNSNDGDVSGNHSMNSDCWIVKLDSIGNIQWQKCFGGIGNDQAHDIIQLADGGYVFVGNAELNNGDISGNHGDEDLWMVKLDITGNIQWQKCFGGSFSDGATEVQQTSDKGYIISGWTSSNDGQVTQFHGFYDSWLVKTDSTGNLQWQKCIGGTNDDRGLYVKELSNKKYMVGLSTNSTNGDIIGNHGDFDMTIFLTDSIGNIINQKCFGGFNADFCVSINSTQDNGFFATGGTNSIDGDVTGFHGGNYDLWILKTDSLLNLKWQKCFGGSLTDGFSLPVFISEKEMVLAGLSDSFDGDVYSNHGNRDIWVIKLVFPTISGKVFNDLNNNGICDNNEQGISGQMVRLLPGPEYAISNNDGTYYFASADTGNYSISYLPQPYWYSTNNVYNYQISFDSLSQNIDSLNFAVKSKLNTHDKAVYISGSPIRPGFETDYWLTVKNWGTVTENVDLNFAYDSLISFNNSSETPTIQVGNTLTWNNILLGPGTSHIIRANFHMQADTIHLGDSLFSHAWVTPLLPDTNIINNHDTLYQVVTGSYDPNDKVVSPLGIGQEGLVLHNTKLTYTIRFQNTGTDTAFKVVIRDTINTNFNIETFQILTSSHPVTYQINNNREIVFTFYNILLPDSNVNNFGSQGFVKFSIKPKLGLADSTVVENKAYIFFDYNPAIVTNSTHNTFVSTLSFLNIIQIQRILTFPNPANNLIWINLPEFTRSIEIFSIEGKFIKTIIPQNELLEINIQDYTKGIYTIKINKKNKVYFAKFIKN